eukprot:m.1462016 g.1462016  ORF g.1462016 m.1462016 type:complete len:602 (+) comp25133_c2_seq16:178-1983(+)
MGVCASTPETESGSHKSNRKNSYQPRAEQQIVDASIRAKRQQLQQQQQEQQIQENILQRDEWTLDNSGVGVASVARQQLVRSHDISSNTTAQDIYEFGTLVARGGTAMVYLVRHKHSPDQRLSALKIVDLSSFNEQQKQILQYEIGISKLLDHPNCIKIHEVFNTGTQVQIVMELCHGGDLREFLYLQPNHRVSEALARPMAAKILRALAYLHANRLVHRDIKPENFMFSSRNPTAEIKLIDFGVSRQFTDKSKMTRTTGTLEYMAPEVLNHDYTEASDLWSFGVMLFEMITGKCPFREMNPAAEIKRRVQDPTRLHSDLSQELHEFSTCSNVCAQFVLALLTPNVESRLTAMQALQHPWIMNRVKPTSNSELGSKSDQPPQFEALNKQLNAFKDRSSLEHAALLALSVHMSSSDLQTLNQEFFAMDENHDGLISLHEFKRVMDKHACMGIQDVEANFAALDQDKTGVIKYSEFIAAALQEELMQREDHLEAAFHRLDADSNGTISIDELTRVLPTRSRHEVQQALTKFDTNGDGMLDLAEFKYALRSLHSNLGADEDIAVAEDNTAPLNTFGGVGSTSIRPAPATTTRRIHGTHIQISIV